MSKESPLQSYMRRSDVQTERNAVAGAIRAKRRERDATQKRMDVTRDDIRSKQKISELQDPLQQELLKQQQDLKQINEQLETTQREVDAIEKTVAGKTDKQLRPLLDALGIKWRMTKLQEKQAHLQETDTKKKATEKDRDEIKRRFQSIKQATEELETLNIQYKEMMADRLHISRNAHDLLEHFYLSQMEQWESTPFSLEEMGRQFTEENLSKLSIQDYTFLLRRFPSTLVTHVTRQGVRDHTGHNRHTAGIGEFHRGFEGLLADGRLRSTIGRWLESGAKKEAIVKMLRLEEMTREEALRYLEILTSLDSQRNPMQLTYADMTSVHVAAEEVADLYYGAESGNEMFFVFPSAHIASQHYFHGQLSQAHGYEYNDQWIWSDDHRGLGLNAGICFIPESAPVDPKTGSRYQLNESMESQPNQRLVDEMKKVVRDPTFRKLVKEAYDAKPQYQQDFPSEELRTWLEENVEQLTPTLMDFFSSLEVKTIVFFNTDIDRAVRNGLQRSGNYFQLAEKTITSKEYWEQYFAQYPEQKPNRIFYYHGDPTAALSEFRTAYGIRNTKQLIGGRTPEELSEETDVRLRPDVGFRERSVKDTSERALHGMEKFDQLAKEIIDEYYAVHARPAEAA